MRFLASLLFLNSESFAFDCLTGKIMFRQESWDLLGKIPVYNQILENIWPRSLKYTRQIFGTCCVPGLVLSLGGIMLVGYKHRPCSQRRRPMTPHSSTLAWKIPWMEEPGGLQSMGSLRVRHDWATSLSLFTFIHWRRKWQPTPVILPGESPGRGSLVGCRLWGHTESDTTEVT